VDAPAEVKSATRDMIFQGIQEAAETWLERALTAPNDPNTYPRSLILDAPLIDERSGLVSIDRARNFKLTRPDRIGYTPFPLLYRCGTCGRLREFDNANDQAANPLPDRCSGHSARWSQVDVVYAHWSGGLEPLSPFRYQHNAASGEVSRISKCDCGSDEFKLKNDASVFSEWKFICMGCGATRELKQADPMALRLIKPRMDRGERHEWIEINMLPVSYRASSAYYVQKGYFIDFEDRRVVDLMMPPARDELLRTLATLHGFPYDEPSEIEIEAALIAAGKATEYQGWKLLRDMSEKFRGMGLAAQADTNQRDAQKLREAWFEGGVINRGSVRSQALAAAVQDRTEWARRYDPIRLTVEHDIFVREHIHQQFPQFGAVDVLDPDRLISEAAGDDAKLQVYRSTTQQHMSCIGIERMVLIRSLPICEYSFGYSRVSANPVYAREHGNRSVNMPVRLNTFPMLPDGTHHPVYVLEQKNEALYIRLSEARVQAWLRANNVTPAPHLDKPGIAGSFLEQYSDFTSYLDEFKDREGRTGAARQLCPYIYMLLHSLSHQMIHALSELSGLDRDAIGEHIFPADLAFVIYRKGMTPELGNISAMWRNYSSAFLQRILDPRLLRCGSGSLCDTRGAACPACIMLPDLTCIASNQLLSRSALKGGPPPNWEARTNPLLVGYFDPVLVSVQP
jgi:DNA-directed RNA polymerase subunit RPC12/RpoP